MAVSQEQKEYNELLKMTQSLLGGITKQLEGQTIETNKRRKGLENNASLTKQILNNIEDTKDAEKAISSIEKIKETVSKKYFGTNQKIGQQFLIQLSASQQILKTYLREQEVLEKVSDIVNQQNEKMKGFVDSIDSAIQKIPLIGDVLSKSLEGTFTNINSGIDSISQGFIDGFVGGFTEAKLKTTDLTSLIQGGLSKGISNASNILKSLPSGMKQFVIGIGLAFVGFKILSSVISNAAASFTRIDEAGKSFRERTGLLNSQTESLNRKLVTTETQFANIGASAELAADAAGAFTTTFDGLVQPSQAVLSSLVAINKSFGVSLEDASSTVRVFRNLADLTEEQATSLTLSVGQASKLAGIAPRQVFQDIAESSSDIQSFFGGNVQLIAQSAVEARKLGTSIGNVVKLSQSLLDFESSINSELEASAILGTRLNFSQARLAAANNDALGAFQSISNELDKIGDLTRLNVFERQALASATGMEFQELLNQQRIRERFGTLDQNQLRAAQEFLKVNGDINNLTQERLQNQAEQIAKQDDFNSRVERLQNQFNAVKISIQNAFLPLAETFLPVLMGIGNIVSKITGFFATLEKSTSLVSASLIVMGSALTIIGARMAFLAIKSIVSAIAQIFASAFSAGPLGIGLAIAGTAALIGSIAAASNAARQQIGDGEFTDGSMRISSQEGGLNLIPSRNDDVVVAPGLSDFLQGISSRNDGVVVTPGLSDFLQGQREGNGAMINLQPLVQKMDELVNATKARTILVADGKSIASSTSYNDEISLRNNFGMNQTKFSRR